MCPIVEMFYLNSTSIDIPVRSLLVRQTSNWSNCSIKGTTARWYSKKHLYQLFLSNINMGFISADVSEEVSSE